MKAKNILVALSLFGVGMLSSCESMLDIEPQSYYIKDKFFKDADQAEMSVKGIYDVLSTKYTYSHLLSLNYPMDNDISFMKGATFNNDNRLIAHYTVTPTTSLVERTWGYLYKGVENANVAIEGIHSMDLYKNGTDASKKRLFQLEAEAKFMRAFLYFDLVRLWGDVPLKTTATVTSDDYSIERSDRDLVYAQIIKDLREAKSLLGEDTGYQNDRVSQGAISGYIVRALLYRAGYYLAADGNMKRSPDYLTYYKEAAVEAKELMDRGTHDLLDDYEQLFKNLAIFKQDAKENLFEIAFFNASHGTQDAGIIGTWNSPLVKAGKYGRANAYVQVVPTFKDEFEGLDQRRDVSVADFTIDADGSHKSIGEGKPFYPGKWRRDWIAEPAQNPNNTNVNWCTLRYADVLLMFAEAVNEVRDDLPAGITLQDGFDAINKVRKRAGVIDVENTLDHNDFLLAIQKERKLELCFEGWRKYDLIRWNLLDTKIKETQAKMNAEYPSANSTGNQIGYLAGNHFEANKHELLPIPQREIAENNKLKEHQNPKY
ncbi:RagB/SusD family nutrient uptake outer membrane protein [Halosquirtibacter xylanolyticus]|uniref:RagB/SusD family nutrient uptake outer membrane protein n=1 Tax=Halosquirtibacter xylanolyticus TaxID=3374599 RepID=UPI003749EFAF|nr:RagB/SusD family nutrient uptake outer membrane protein [Prolixibacteraceae bacterium]